MTRHIHIEPVGGIAGDMFVSAMLDAFPEYVKSCWNDLEQAGVLLHVDIELLCGSSKGLAVKRFNVNHRSDNPTRTGNYRDIRQWLEQGKLDEAVKQRALALLHSLAEAESHVHGVDIEQVHFHEVADWDSIADMVAAASLIERTAVASWSCAALPLGSGLVKTEHGLLPVPAPATAFLLRGIEVWDDGEAGERVTPTGAAIVRHLLASGEGELNTVSTRPRGRLSTAGCGAGQRDLQHRPNIVRCTVFDPASAATDVANMGDSSATDPAALRDSEVDQVLEINFDIDDMTGEEMAVSLDTIRLHDGVLDVSHHLAVGKKGRSVYRISILCDPVAEQSVCQMCFHETTTLGMRLQRISRRVLRRSEHKISDAFGTAQIKVAERPDGHTAKVESDDLAGLPGLQVRRNRARRLLDNWEF
ncbi:MAG: LarC family nickel insertion protein [Granulosicoccus sp.]